jgi:N4-(beta-N-acetylglucosaminyl)-L-asparaginase
MGKLTRRQIIAGGAAIGLGSIAKASPFTTNFWIQSGTKPIVIASANGFMDKNAGPRTAVEEAYLQIGKGADILDALIAGVNIVELDPTDSSVGYGGMPNANGVVQLDSCCMHGPKRRAGGVAALEGVRTPSKVAKAVADLTDNHLLAGAGAQEFARSLGFAIEADLNTENSRKAWLEWKRRMDHEHYLDEKDREIKGLQAAVAMANEGWMDPQHVYGTINCNGINEKGDIAGVTTTSGIAFKIPGRVGDSPILGAGLYVDQNVGAAGSTGRGESNLYNCSSYLVIEEMRRGAHPKDACVTALKRVASNTVEKRLMNEKGEPNYGLVFYAVDTNGVNGGVAFTPGYRYSVCDDKGPRFVECESLYTS